MAESGKAFPVSWEQFHRDARALSWRLAQKAEDWSALVAITRGGLVPAAIVARELDIRLIDTACIASYGKDDRQTELDIMKPISQAVLERTPEGAGLLVIDDLADTGRTARALRAMAPRAHIATVYAKPLGAEVTDTFVTEVSQDTWIHFPWDLELAYSTPIADSS